MQNQTVTIQGKTFSIPAPFATGHTLNDNEAAAMNQLYAENIRNNFAGRMKKAEEASQPVPGQDALDAYCASYQFGVRVGGTRSPVDPVEREAEDMAEKAVKRALAQKNIKLKSLPEGKLEQLVAEVLANNPKFREQAAAIVAARNAATAEIKLSG